MYGIISAFGFTDETPTPSRYMGHPCEGLFEEVCTGLNPFDEQFRRASQARTQPHITLGVSYNASNGNH